MENPSSSPTIYLIRHGEKPDGDADGLSTKGVTRAQYLPLVFGPTSKYDIKYIMAEQPHKGESLSFFEARLSIHFGCFLRLSSPPGLGLC
jgi:hypothetical protein